MEHRRFRRFFAILLALTVGLGVVLHGAQAGDRLAGMASAEGMTASASSGCDPCCGMDAAPACGPGIHCICIGPAVPLAAKAGAAISPAGPVAPSADQAGLGRVLEPDPSPPRPRAAIAA